MRAHKSFTVAADVGSADTDVSKVDASGAEATEADKVVLIASHGGGTLSLSAGAVTVSAHAGGGGGGGGGGFGAGFGAD